MASNIDPVFFATPIVVLVFSLGLTVYWRKAKRLTGWVLLYSAVAYFAAIILKFLLQHYTYSFVAGYGDGNPIVLGAYYGAQTVFFEVGLAYVLAQHAANKGRLLLADASAYGVSLGVWENGVLVSIPALIDYAAYYILLSSPSSETYYSVIHSAAPSLFLPPLEALPLVGFAVLERASSFMLHYAWGTLAVAAAVTRRRTYLCAALPMGLADFLLPFEPIFGLAAFEATLFAFALLSLIVSIKVTSNAARQTLGGSIGPNISSSTTTRFRWSPNLRTVRGHRSRPQTLLLIKLVSNTKYIPSSHSDA